MPWEVEDVALVRRVAMEFRAIVARWLSLRDTAGPTSPAVVRGSRLLDEFYVSLGNAWDAAHRAGAVTAPWTYRVENLTGGGSRSFPLLDWSGLDAVLKHAQGTAEPLPARARAVLEALVSPAAARGGGAAGLLLLAVAALALARR